MASDSTGHPELPAAIQLVVASYDGPEAINNLESAALPNERRVIEAFAHLQAAIFMGFYSTHALSRGTLERDVSEHLCPAYELLCDQIARAIAYEKQRDGVAVQAVDWAEKVMIGFLRGLPRLRRQLNADVRAAYAGDPAAASIEEIVFSYPSIEALTAHRIAHLLYVAGVPMIPRIITEHAHAQTGIDIHPGARIGDAFFIDHGTGVVIGETTVIGNNVKLYQGVTLGALSTSRSEEKMMTQRHPTIEDGVTIYAGATILGGETVIGAGSVIGGNVWLTKSVPPGSKIFGRART